MEEPDSAARTACSPRCRRHVDADRGNAGSASIASIVMDVGNRTVYVASGPPCSHEYRAVTVPGATQPADAPTAPAVATPA